MYNDPPVHETDRYNELFYLFFFSYNLVWIQFIYHDKY